MTVATSTIPSVLTALLEKLNGLTWPAMIGGQPVYVFDGIVGPSQPDNTVVVGGEQDPAAEGDQEWMTVGGRRRQEEYTIEITASSYVGGESGISAASTAASTAALVSNAQASARTNAFAIVGAIEAALRADPQLQQVTDPPDPGAVLYCAFGSRIVLTQTTEDDPESPLGRIATVTFDVQVKGTLAGA